jgi:hypothetical protein
MKVKASLLGFLWCVLLLGAHSNLHAENTHSFSYQSALNAISRVASTYAEDFPEPELCSLRSATTHVHFQAEVSALEVEEEEVSSESKDNLPCKSAKALLFEGGVVGKLVPRSEASAFSTRYFSFYTPVSRCIAFQVFRL